MSNFKLILLVIGVFIALMVFGHSPIDEVRKRRAERASKTLINKIETANSKKGGPLGTASGLAPPLSDINRPGAAVKYNNGINPFQTANPYSHPNTNAQRFPGPNQPFNANAPNAPVAPVDEYYPPEPKNKQIRIPLSSLPDSNARAAANKALGNPNIVTDNGTMMSFVGSNVYVYDDEGKMKPMPDGKYPMYGGKWTMVVRGGAQTIGVGDTENW